MTSPSKETGRVEHTPTPWRAAEVRAPAGIKWDQIIRGPAGEPICSVSMAGYSRGVAEANAALIVRAVNAHDDLVAALKQAREACLSCIIMYGDENPDDDWTAIKKARAAKETCDATLSRIKTEG